MSSEQHADSAQLILKPRFDTWGMKKYAGSWCITPLLVDEGDKRNDWYVTVLHKTVEAFANLARPRFAYFSSLEEGTNLVVVQWDGKASLSSYIETIVEAIRNYAAPIYTFEMEVDLHVYARTEDSPNTPMHGWFRLPSKFVFKGATEDYGSYLCFEIAHTLFCSSSMDGSDNSELYTLNQPLLEQALRTWETQVGPIDEVDGLPGIYEYGFRPFPENPEEAGE